MTPRIAELVATVRCEACAKDVAYATSTDPNAKPVVLHGSLRCVFCDGALKWIAKQR